MSRERRYNFIFFGCLLVLMTPGFFILMHKKLTGRSDPNYMPNALPSSIAYMQQPPFPPGMPVVEPSPVREWVTQLLQNKSPLARTPDDRPVMNNTRQIQLLSRTPVNDVTHNVLILLWAAADITQQPQVKMVDGSTSLLQSASLVDVPRPVRHALQRAGYINPPFQLWLISFEAPADTKLRLTYVNTSGETIVESVPTND
jgi:hypothetical protein